MGRKFKISEEDFDIAARREEDSSQEEHFAQDVQKAQEEAVKQTMQKIQNGHNTQDVQDTHEIQSTQTDESEAPQEIVKRKAEEGKKNINLAMSKTLYEYVKRQSRFYGMNATSFINKILEGYMEKDPPKYAEFKGL